MARPTNSERVLIAQRRTRVLAMRVEQRPYREIAAELGITETTARDDYAAAVTERRTALDAQRDTAVAIETAKLDALEQAAWEVLRARHVTVSQGRIVGRYTGRFLRDEEDEVIRDGTGKPALEIEEIEDDAPVLAAIDRLVKIAERRARLRGLDAPTKVDISDERRAEIEKYAAELAAWVGDVDGEGAGDAPGEAAPG
jgi:predicted transcriptional regulator